MTFFKSHREAVEGAHFNVHEVCLCCGKLASGAIVAWDLILPGEETYSSVLLHRRCAFRMAQGLILDTWPNRYKDPTEPIEH